MNTLCNMLNGEGGKLNNLLGSEKKSGCKTGVNGKQKKLDNVPDHQSLFSHMLGHIMATDGKGHAEKTRHGLAALLENSDSGSQKETLSQAGGAEKDNTFLIGKDKAGKAALGKEPWINSILTGGEENKTTLRVSPHDLKSNNGKSINHINASDVGEFVKNMKGDKGNVVMPFQHSGAGQLSDEEIIQTLEKLGLDKKQITALLSMKPSDKDSMGYRFKESGGIQKTVAGMLGYVEDKQKDTPLKDGNKQVHSENKKGQAIPSDDLKGDLLKENRNTADNKAVKEIKTRAESSVSKVHTGDKGEFAVEKDSPKRTNPQNISGPRDNMMSANQEQHVKKVSVFGGSEQGASGDGDRNGLEERDSGAQKTKALNRNPRFSEMRQQAITQAGSPSTGIDKNNDRFVVRPSNIINQVVDASGKKLGKGFGRIKITLNPPHLGSVDMDVLVRDNKVHVILRAEHLDVKQLLQSNTEQLKTALNNQGLAADNISVSVQERTEDSPFELGQDSTLFDGNQAKNGKNANEEKGNDPSDQVSTEINEQDVHVQSNGEISLFV
ncbi:MAG: flagellar hook-length control protein FliK [Planctomycetaceae bacterium]|nr:MAG: flagellar hook-length control protein FliK [Planctomycetaceae bacterium]